MNHYTGYELLWLFFIYSFGGWVLETISATLKQRKFANRGLVNGPFCVLYGLTAIAMTVGLQELRGIWLFIFATVYATVAEWVSGHLIEKAFKARWCNGITLILLHILPKFLMHIVLLTLIGVLFVDIFGSFMLLTGKSKNPERWIATDAGMDKISTKIAGKIAGSLEKRLKKAYPKARKIEEEIREENEEKVFAKGCGFYKIVMLFMIGAFLGDITETIFCRVTAGVWMSRSSVVWGPFSIVWGLAIALVTALLYKYKDKEDRFLFLTGTLLGGAYEYFCSVFTELVFGKVFWDYSKIPFNLGGRINLLYCFFWGIAAVVWFKILFPPVEKWIEKIPAVAGKILTWVLLGFMVCNILVSCVALVRYDERGNGVQATNAVQKWADAHYGDAKMKKIYPNAKGIN